jgi:hypothetical protein
MEEKHVACAGLSAVVLLRLGCFVAAASVRARRPPQLLADLGHGDPVASAFLPLVEGTRGGGERRSLTSFVKNDGRGRESS